MSAIAPSETRRLRILRDAGLLDSAREPAFDDIAALAARILGTPVALVSLWDETRPWLKAVHSPAHHEPAPTFTFCSHTLLQTEPLIISDAALDPRFAHHPVVTGPAALRFYAGAPLVLEAGVTLGTLCVIDHQPRTITADQIQSLQILANQVVNGIRLRLHARENERGAELLPLQNRLTLDQLHDSQTLLRIAGETARIGGWTIGLPDNVVRWSDEICQILDAPVGYVPTFQEALELHPESIRPTITRLVDACARDGTPFDTQLTIKTFSGRLIWARSIGRPIRDASGVIIGLQGAFQDITSQKEAERSAAAIEDRLRQQGEVLPFIVWTATPTGEVDHYSKHFFDYTGVSRDEDPIARWQPCVHPDDLPNSLVRWEKALRDGHDYETEHRLRRHDGIYRWFRVQAYPIRNPDGTIALWYGIGIDTHDTRQLQNQTARLAQRLTNTLESITDGFLTIDRDWRFTYLNHEAERLLQSEHDTLLNRIIWDAFPDTVGSNLERQYRLALDENRTIKFDEYFASLGKWFELRAYPSDEGLAVYFRDITEAKLTNAKLREQAALLDKAQDAILLRDLDHTIRYWNKSAERLYGWTAEEAIGRSIQELLYRTPETFIKAVQATLETGEWTGQLQQIHRNGQPLLVEARWTLLRNTDGHPESILSINTDITERHKLEQQFLRAQRMESIGTLAGGIAHDLNNLLSPILMGVDLLRHLGLDARATPIIDNMGRSARRGTDLVKQVLSFARGVEGARVSIQIAEILHEIESIIINTFPKNILLEESIPNDLWPVTGDPTQLNQVFLNLCVNARDAMPDGGRLTLTAHNIEIDEQYAAMDRAANAGRYVVVLVADEGFGMSKEVQERIFEPFFTTKEIGKGTGLGLSTAMGIVRSHGGFVNVYSELGKGTVFKVYLPIQLDSTHLPSATSHPEVLPRGQGECILLVDDEVSILTITKQTLEAFGYKVLTAEDGAQAIAVYASTPQPIAVVLTDMMMPIMDGPALISALRRLNPDQRIIAASGLNANGTVAKASRAGVKHFLPKPYSADRMLTLLRTVIDE